MFFPFIAFLGFVVLATIVVLAGLLGAFSSWDL